MFRAEQHAFFQPVAALEQPGQLLAPFVLLDLGEEAKMAQVNPQHRQSQRRGDAPRAQHGPIPTQGNQQVELARFDATDQGSVLEYA